MSTQELYLSNKDFHEYVDRVKDKYPGNTNDILDHKIIKEVGKYYEQQVLSQPEEIRRILPVLTEEIPEDHSC